MASQKQLINRVQDHLWLHGVIIITWRTRSVMNWQQFMLVVTEQLSGTKFKGCPPNTYWVRTLIQAQ